MNHPTEAQLLAYGRKFFSWRTTACICKCLRAPELLSDRRLASVLLRMIAAMAPMPENPCNRIMIP
jgi:hypothetical protein